MTGKTGRTIRRGIATLASATLIAVGAASPAGADSTADPTVWVDIWNGRSAYHGPTTVQFFLMTDTVGYPLTSDKAYAAAAEHGLARIDLLADGVLVGTTTEQPWTITWDPSTLPEAPVRLTARSYDQTGHIFDATFSSSVDHTAPTLRVYQNGYIRAGGEIYVEAADKSRITRIDLLADDKIIDSSAASTTLLHWDRNAINGPATLAVRARDTAGNVAEYRRAVLVDNVPPAFTITPASGAHVRGTVSFTASGVRDASGIGSLEVGFAGTWYSSEPAAPKVARVDTRGIPDGRKVVQCTAFDRAGNTTTIKRTVTLDNHAPTVTFAKAPKNKARVSRSFPITAKAADRYGIARVQMLVNGKVVATDSKAGYRFTINPKKYGKKFTVHLRAYDKAGNLKNSSKRTYRR
ncbi:Ig-like domain-containing protein [Actinoplanes sp. ATCC 53533]|uniref:Ig-like domain-containing protein n=1 Tax=Actinoplanes sp. ATCC 53533 TaxID=1288362 RepID=UPI00131560C2|nr:Ig-like domain-containing protein [Actinoplanes sp. ATCC 53533]